MPRPSAVSATLDPNTDVPTPGPCYPGTLEAQDPDVGPITLATAASIAPSTRVGLVHALDQVVADATYHGLARVTGLSRSHLTGILKGRRNCTVAYAERLASALGVSTAELLAYSGAKRVALAAAIFAGRAKGIGVRRSRRRGRKKVV